MKYILTERQLKVLSEQDFLKIPSFDFGIDRQKKINATWCSVNFGVVQNQRPLKVQWCGKGGYKEQMKVSDDETLKAIENCPKKIFSTPPINKEKDGFYKIYNYYKTGVDGSTLEAGLAQEECQNDYYDFVGKNKDGNLQIFWSDGELEYKSKSGNYLRGTWDWDGKKPVLNLPFTRKAVGYAQTEEDITNNNKILYTGSNNDLVKRIQYQIMVVTKGKTNTGCKKDVDNHYKPSLCDGIFGPKTKKAVQDFQRSEGLKDKSGIVGGETWGMLSPSNIDWEGYTQEDLEKGQ